MCWGSPYGPAIRRAFLAFSPPALTRLPDLAENALGLSTAAIDARLKDLGATVGRPWRKEQKLAYLSASGHDLLTSSMRFGRAAAPNETDVFDAIRNLVENALKYAPGSAVAVSTALQGDDVVVVVRDHGPGMSEQDQTHAFDRFYRGHAVDGIDGSGIGLAIVKAATERSGGTVSVESRAGGGAAFMIRLPRVLP
jgi:anti-sigma regulatory factor (Ser/Thr protein kinase)